MTGVELVAAGETIKATMSGIVADAGAEGRSAVYSANGALDGAISEFRRTVGGDITKDIGALGGVAGMLASQLRTSIDDIDRLLKLRMQCGLDGIERLIYAIRSIASQLQAAIPIIKNAKPFLYGFSFVGHSPSVIPPEGGRISIKGSQLWRDKTPPDIELVVQDRQRTVLHVDGQAGASPDEVQTLIDSKLLREYSGQCIEWKVTPRRTNWLKRRRLDEPLFLPFCIPKTIRARYRFQSMGLFSCNQTATPIKLQEQEFRCDNNSCENRSACSVQKTWAVPTDCQVLHVDSRAGEMRNNANVTLTNVGGSVTASGTLDEASCLNLGIGKKFLHSTIWQTFAAPVISCTSHVTLPVIDISPELPFNVTSNVPSCIKLPMLCDTTESTWNISGAIVFPSEAPQPDTPSDKLDDRSRCEYRNLAAACLSWESSMRRQCDLPAGPLQNMPPAQFACFRRIMYAHQLAFLDDVEPKLCKRPDVNSKPSSEEQRALTIRDAQCNDVRRIREQARFYGEAIDVPWQFTTPSFPVGGVPFDFPSYDYEGVSFKGRVHADRISKNVEVCVTATPTQCGY